MNAIHSGTVADQQLQVFYVRAERPLTLVRASPNSSGERASAWRVSNACVKRGGSQDSWGLVVVARQSEYAGPCRLWRMEIAKNEQKQLMPQFIARQLRNKSPLARRRTADVSASSLPTRSNVENIATTEKTFIKQAHCPYNWYLTKKRKAP